MRYEPGALPTNATSANGAFLSECLKASCKVRTSKIRPCTPVRTPCHSHHDGVIPKATLFHDRLYFVYQNRKILDFPPRVSKIRSETKRGLTRSDSAMARPQVGNATQAEDDSRSPLWVRLSSLYLASSSFIAGTSASSMSARMRC